MRPSKSMDKRELVSGDIFNGSSGKYVIAEAERMPRSWESTLLNFETCRGDFASPFIIFEGLQDFFFTADKTRKHNFLIRPSSRHIRHFHSWEFIAMLSTLCFGPHQLLVDMGIAIFEGLQDFFTADKTRKTWIQLYLRNMQKGSGT